MMPFQWISMLEGMLATESRMVLHVAVGAVDSRILVNLVIELEGMENPLNVGWLLLWR